MWCFIVLYEKLIHWQLLTTPLQADDEQSDWPGPEPGMSVMQLTDEEIDPEISFSQVSHVPSYTTSLTVFFLTSS